MHSWYTAQELAGLPGMPGTDRNVRLLAERKGWQGKRRAGSKAIEYSFSILPLQVQTALLARSMQGDLPAAAARPAPPHQLVSPARDGVSRLTDEQREVMAARVALIREIERLSQLVSQQQAIMTLVELARAGRLSPYLDERVERANDRKNPQRSLSERTLKRWLAGFRKHGESALAPLRRKPDMSVPAWAPVFLRHYQRPQKPSMEAAYATFQAEYPGYPSIHVVRRFLAKLAPQVREQGRMGNRVLEWVPAQAASLADVRRLASESYPGLALAEDLLADLARATRGCLRRMAVNLHRVNSEASASGMAAVNLAAWGKRGWFTGQAPVRRPV